MKITKIEEYKENWQFSYRFSEIKDKDKTPNNQEVANKIKQKEDKLEQATKHKINGDNSNKQPENNNNNNDASQIIATVEEQNSNTIKEKCKDDNDCYQTEIKKIVKNLLKRIGALKTFIKQLCQNSNDNFKQSQLIKDSCDMIKKELLSIYNE